MVEPRPHIMMNLSPEVTAIWDRAMHYLYRAKRLEHRNLRDVVESFSAKLGIKPPPLYMAPKFPDMLGGAAPNMLAAIPTDPSHAGAVVSTESMLKLFDYTPHAPVAKELQAFLAHELEHLRHQKAAMFWQTGQASTVIGAAATVAAMFIMDKVLKPGAPKTPDKESLSRAADALQAEMDASRGPAPHECAEAVETARRTERNVLRAGEMIAGVALGAVATHYAHLHVTPRAMRHFEFEADKAAALLMGDHKPMISGLRKLEKGIIDHFRANPSRIPRLNAAQMEELRIEHAHPSFAERIAALEEIGKTLLGKAQHVR